METVNDGDGSGRGIGDGDGSGSGSGSGIGYGYGIGIGYGSGSGSGYGYGYGIGYGDGIGDGSGIGDKQSNSYLCTVFGGKRGRELLQQGCTIAYWKSRNDGRPANNGTGPPRRAGMIEETPGPLRDQCGEGQLHATWDLDAWEGDRIWIVALYPPVKDGGNKMWSLKREIICELGKADTA